MVDDWLVINADGVCDGLRGTEMTDWLCQFALFPLGKLMAAQLTTPRVFRYKSRSDSD
ncbi:hypothetical protein Mettu_1581 [Methylobacter tundripaludum SV96]|uniref:Uncharacterized protein n=1 Tax=Methylobacter tundripaludum (strain ATCC BAA-1195 / DSM 17260 / SV96) TaxID=697282 RepID=G3IUN4_METTV|nr:hypothetical protein Mettu_1581 [Methylobacter tundripaludum SV96]